MFPIFLFFSLFSLLFIGCQPSKPGQESQKSGIPVAQAHKAIRPVRINIGIEPQSLDPRKARDLCGFALMRMLFEGLTRANLKDQVELALAQEVSTSEDGLIYTFKLRKSDWSNGDPVTAEDFVYAWRKMVDPSFASDNVFQLYVIKNAQLAKEGKVPLDQLGATAVDPLTLVVELEHPVPYFLDLLNYPAFYPINHKVDLAEPQWAEKVSTYVSNGPFLLKDWKHDNKIEVKKNEKYWDASSVKLSEIEMVMVKEDAEFFMFENKELDWAGSPLSVLPLDAMPVLKHQKNLQVKPFLGTFFLRVNTGRKLLKESRFRKAFAYAIDRQAIVNHVALGNQLPAQSLVPFVMGLRMGAYFSDGDLANARLHFEQALEASKMTLKNFPQMSLMYVSSERANRIVQTIQQQWNEAFGVQIRLEPVERKVYYDRLSHLDYDLAAGSWIADFNDPVSFLEVFKQKTFSTNNTGWENPDYIRLLDASYAAKNGKERLAMLEKCEEILIDQMPVIPIFHYSMSYLNQTQLKDVALSHLGNIDFKWAYFEEEDKK